MENELGFVLCWSCYSNYSSITCCSHFKFILLSRKWVRYVHVWHCKRFQRIWIRVYSLRPNSSVLIENSDKKAWLIIYYTYYFIQLNISCTCPCTRFQNYATRAKLELTCQFYVTRSRCSNWSQLWVLRFVNDVVIIIAKFKNSQIIILPAIV